MVDVMTFVIISEASYPGVTLHAVLRNEDNTLSFAL